MIRRIVCLGVFAALFGRLVSVSFAQAPTVSVVIPFPGSQPDLTEISVQFSDDVTGVDASDLLINGVPASAVQSLTPFFYAFAVPRAALVGGMVHVMFAANNNIAGTNGIPFDSTGVSWDYTLPPVLIAFTPSPGNVPDLTQVTVQFSEPVSGVDASDLLINSVPATSVSANGSVVPNTIYTFSFPRPALNGGAVSVTWSGIAGITNAAGVAFDGQAFTARATYFVPDITAPFVADLTPAPGSTVRPLQQIQVTFDEPVTNVLATDLLLNGKPATNVLRQSPSVYIFQFVPAKPGVAQAAWSDTQGITDLAGLPFAGGEAWSYFGDTTPYSILLHTNNNTATVLFSNKFDKGVGTIEGKSGKTWVPLENFFITHVSGQATVPLPTNYTQYTQFRLRTLSVAPGNAFQNLAQAYGNIETVAGNGAVPPGTNAWQTNYEGMLATEVPLSNPRSAIADAAGNIYVSEEDGAAVDKIDLQGRIHTVLGTHTNGTFFDDDQSFLNFPNLRPLNKPTGLWLNGNFLYVLDSGNARVRELGLATALVRTLFVDPSGITNGSGLWVAANGLSAFYTDGSVLKRWTFANGISIVASNFVDLAGVTVDPIGRTIVADRGEHRVYRARNNGSYIFDVLAGNGHAEGPSNGGKATLVSLPGADSVWFLPIGGYFVSLDEGARVWYVDSGNGAAPLIFGAPGAHQGDGEWFQLHRTRPKVGTVQSVTLAPSGDIILVEGNAYVRKIDFLRHKP